MQRQAWNYTAGVDGAPSPPEWGEVREVRCACTVGSLLGFVARRVAADPPGKRTMAASGADPGGRLEHGRRHMAGLMPTEPGYLALFVVERPRQFRDRRPVDRADTLAVLSAPVNAVRCRGCRERRLVNLADLEQRLPADGAAVRV